MKKTERSKETRNAKRKAKEICGNVKKPTRIQKKEIEKNQRKEEQRQRKIQKKKDEEREEDSNSQEKKGYCETHFFQDHISLWHS